MNETIKDVRVFQKEGKSSVLAFLAWALSIATTSGTAVLSTTNSISIIPYMAVSIEIIPTIVARRVWWPLSRITITAIHLYLA
jgi:hypothetical protein